MIPNWLIVSVIITVQMFACPVQVERATYASPYPKQWRNVVITVDPAGQVISARFRPNGQPSWAWPQAYPWSIQGGKATTEGPDDWMKRAGGQYFALTTAVVDVPGNGLPKFPKGYALDLPSSSAPTAPSTDNRIYYSDPGPPASPEWPPSYIKIPSTLSVYWLNSQTFVLVPSGAVIWAAGMPSVAVWPREELR